VRAPTPSAAAEIVVPDRAEFLAGVRSAGRRLDASVSLRTRAAAREVAAERRALDRLSPSVQLTMSRERDGLLLDRATRAIADRTATDRTGVERLGRRRAPTLPARLAEGRRRLARTEVMEPIVVRRVAGARGSLSAAGAALAVLGPQATLDRGYAIVRRAGDGSIVRDPAEAPAGTRLDLRVATGELPATADPR
jgi:exodeoxyribonuclease VII large subunit